MEPYSFIPLFAFLVSLFLAGYALGQKDRPQSSQSHLVFVACLGTWQFLDWAGWNRIWGVFTLDVLRAQTLVWTLATPLFLNFIHDFVKEPRKTLFWTLLILGFVLGIVGATTDLVIKDIVTHSWGIAFVPGPFYLPSVLICVVLPAAAGAVLLRSTHGTSQEIEFQNQISWVFSGIVATVGIGVLLAVFLPAWLGWGEVLLLGSSAGGVITISSFWILMRRNFLSVSVAGIAPKVFSWIQEGILLVDREKNIYYANRSAMEMLGPKVSAGTPVYQVLRFPIYDFDDDLENKEYPIGTGTARQNLLLSQYPIVHRGILVGKAILVRDQSKEELVEQSLSEARLASRTAVQARSELLANLSHQVLTPLNGIIGMAELLRGEDNPETLRRYANQVLTDGNVLQGILTKLLDLSKLEGGQVQLESVRFRLTEFLDGITSKWKARFEQKGIGYALHLEAGLPEWIEGDSGKLSSALDHILDNALAFSEKGSLAIALRCRSRTAQKISLQFAVTDSGCGIDADDKEQVFTSLLHKEKPTTTRQGGVGAGASVARFLVELMGGEIGLESLPGEGSTFWFHVPFAIVAAPEPVKQRKGRILLVEDYAVNQEIATRHLTSAGYQVIQAWNGQEAIERSKSGVLDLILMDVQMPIVDGYQATREIRRLRGGQWIPIVGMTAHTHAMHRAECTQAGMDDILNKPIQKARLLDRVAYWLNTTKPVSAQPTEPASSLAIDQQPHSSSASNVVDIERLMDELEEDKEILVQLFEGFFTQFHEQFDKTHVALADLDRIALEAHKIRGGAANLMASRLAEAAEQCERTARKADLESCTQTYARMISEFGTLESWFKIWKSN